MLCQYWHMTEVFISLAWLFCKSPFDVTAGNDFLDLINCTNKKYLFALEQKSIRDGQKAFLWEASPPILVVLWCQHVQKKKWVFSLIGMADHIIIEHHYTIINKQTKQNNHIFSTIYLVLFHQLRPKEIAQQAFPIKNTVYNFRGPRKKKRKKRSNFWNEGSLSHHQLNWQQLTPRIPDQLG